MKTLLLDRTAWDIVLDAEGNMAIGEAPYAMAQDAASAVRTFKGECWYDTRLGIPYFEQILGQWPPLPLVKALMTKEVMAVPGVVEARVVISSTAGRTLAGQIQITDKAGVITNANF